MGTRDPRVDAYIAKSAEFARPVLSHIREMVHSACPEVEETMKWSSPHFMYHGMLGGMAAFKAHCAFGFWKGSMILDSTGEKASEAMGQFGRIASVHDLPSNTVFTGYVKQAMKLNEGGVKIPKRQNPPKPELPVPAELVAAFKRNAKARAGFEGLSPSHRREYLEWITEAKGEDTRNRRIATAVEWMAQGKSRNWKYEK